MQRDIIGKLASALTLRRDQVERTVGLFDDGNTVPFVARYRKEMTGSLDEEQLRSLLDQLTYLRKLAERQDSVIASITEQGKLTPELETAILRAETLQSVEDLYLPYKPKRRTRAMIARERGLEPLAQLILAQPATRDTVDALARPYLSDDVPTIDDAWQGARDIVAETRGRRRPRPRSRPPTDAARRDVGRETDRRGQGSQRHLSHLLRVQRRAAQSAPASGAGTQPGRERRRAAAEPGRARSGHHRRAAAALPGEPRARRWRNNSIWRSATLTSA